MSKTIVNTNIKLKEGGGMINTPDGLGVDDKSVQTIKSLPAYEDLETGDFLKVIKDGDDYKLGKVVGMD